MSINPPTRLRLHLQPEDRLGFAMFTSTLQKTLYVSPTQFVILLVGDE